MLFPISASSIECVSPAPDKASGSGTAGNGQQLSLSLSSSPKLATFVINHASYPLAAHLHYPVSLLRQRLRPPECCMHTRTQASPSRALRQPPQAFASLVFECSEAGYSLDLPLAAPFTRRILCRLSALIVRLDARPKIFLQLKARCGTSYLDPQAQ